MTKPILDRLREFQDFTLEELLDNDHFIKFLKESATDLESEDLEGFNKKFATNFFRAREIIRMVSDSGDELSEPDVRAIWKKIDFYQNATINASRNSWRSFLGYAAIVILLLSLGTLLFRQFSPGEDLYRFTASSPVDSLNETRIILQTGEEFASSEKVSSIKVTSAGNIEIDNTKEVNVEPVKEKMQVAMNEVVVPFGKKSQLTLSDGTKVWLNAGSRLAFPASFPDDKREVWLEGEAYFDVARDPSKKFFVRVNDLALQVLGTSFNVSGYGPDQSVETVLVSGSLALAVKNNSLFGSREVILTPNQKATYTRAVKNISVEEVIDIEMYTAWTSGWLSFSQQSMKDVAVKMERYYNVRIIFSEGFNSNNLISGKLDLKDSLEAVLDVLSDIVVFKYEMTENQVIISRR